MNQPMQKMPAAALFSEISQYIADSRLLIAEGKIVELSGLDNHIKNLCEMVTALSGQERGQYEQKLSQLAVELDALIKTLHEQKAYVSGEMAQASGVKKASIAYKTADAVDNFGKKSDAS